MSEAKAAVVPPVEQSENKASDDATETPETTTVTKKSPQSIKDEIKPVTTDKATPVLEITTSAAKDVKLDTKDTPPIIKDSAPATEDVKPVIKTSPLKDKTDTVSEDSKKPSKPETSVQKEEAMETSEAAKPLSEITPLDAKIIRQIEYYFGDHNLVRDKFLKEEMKKDDGWVPMDTMVKFQRLSQMSTDYKVICDALRKSKAGLMEVGKANNRIRRVPDKALPEFSKDRRDNMNQRSVYAKGFPEETSLDDLLEFFAKFGPSETLFMRRRPPNREFKGSVFVMFNRKEDAENFVKAESIKYKDIELKRHTKTDYFQMKGDGFKQKKDERSKKGEIDHQKRFEKEKAKLNTTITKGAVIYMKGFTTDTTYREHIHNVFSDFATIVWIDFYKGQREGWIRFDGEGTAKPALEKAVQATDGKLMINEEEIQTSILEGVEEEEYWQKVFNEQAERRARNQNKFQSKRKFDKRGPWQRKGRKRRGDGDGARGDNEDDFIDDNGHADQGGEGEPPSKMIKTETNETIKKETETKEVIKAETAPVKMEIVTEVKTEAIKAE